MDRITPYWKAIVGFVAPGAILIGSSVLETSAGGSTITTSEWVTAGVACVVTAAGVYAKGNYDSTGDHAHESVITR